MRINTKKLVLILILVLLAAIVLTRKPADGQFLLNTNDQCMYPERALIEGRCDNTDPCDPERIKIDGGRCVDKNEPAVDIESDIETLPVDIEPAPTTLPDTGPGK